MKFMLTPVFFLRAVSVNFLPVD